MFHLWSHWQVTDAESFGSAPPSPTNNRSHGEQQIKVDLARLELIVQAMWELMKERGLTDDDLLAKVAELDLSDGHANGKKAKGGPVRCPRCDRPNSRRHDFCMYCGELVRSKPFQ